MGDTRESELIQFITFINNLEPIEFSGIAKILCVALCDEEGKVRPYVDVLSDLIDNFCSIGRRQRREIFKLLKRVEKEKGLILDQKKTYAMKEYSSSALMVASALGGLFGSLGISTLMSLVDITRINRGEDPIFTREITDRYRVKIG